MKKKYSDIEICRRFLKAFDIVCAEQEMTADELARKLGTTGVYISQLRKKDNPQIRPEILATICVLYNVSADHILTGRGEIREASSSIHEAIKRIEHSQDKVITMLLEAVFEFSPEQRRAIDVLIQEVKRRKN